MSNKKRFFNKHHNRFECETQGSSLEYYHKTYTFADGAIWCEVMMKVDVEPKVEVYFILGIVPVELFQIEF